MIIVVPAAYENSIALDTAKIVGIARQTDESDKTLVWCVGNDEPFVVALDFETMLFKWKAAQPLNEGDAK